MDRGSLRVVPALSRRTGGTLHDGAGLARQLHGDGLPGSTRLLVGWHKTWRVLLRCCRSRTRPAGNRALLLDCRWSSAKRCEIDLSVLYWNTMGWYDRRTQ